jgi:hypothetical protein
MAMAVTAPVALPTEPGTRFRARTAASPPDWWFVIASDFPSGPTYMSARGVMVRWRTAAEAGLVVLSEAAEQAPAESPEAVARRVVQPLSEANTWLDRGLMLHPVDPAATAGRVLANLVIDDGSIDLPDAGLEAALTVWWSGPVARAIARRILDECPGQCEPDRHCRMGEGHDGPHFPWGDE